jgi:hypothetical protein
MSVHPPEACLIHRLPTAPHFVGREPELATLRGWWRNGLQGVLALVGLGGAGKTAVAARFLDELLRSAPFPRPEGLFVWSFYQEPDASGFLEEAYHYFSRDSAATTARGIGLLHLLRDALAVGGPHLLVLDGLEKVQRQESSQVGDFGQIEDPLLRGLLLRIAEGMGRSGVLITTRFPVPEFVRFADSGYRRLDIEGLDPAAAVSLLRARGVRGEEPVLDKLVESYGAHALTLDHLGGLIGEFLAGDPSRVPEAPARISPGSDRQALRLARLLRAYEEHLPPAELTLLCRLGLLRRSVKDEQIAHLFLCSPAVQSRTVRELTDLLSRLATPEGFPDWARHDLAQSLAKTVGDALCSAPIAGPEEDFRREVLDVACKVFELHERQIDVDVAELARLYADPSLDVPTDRCPLPAGDREMLRSACAHFLELAQHPLLPFKEDHLPEALEEAFARLGWARPSRRHPGDPTPMDLLRSWQRVRAQLRYLTGKHFALQRVRQLCQAHQQKWSAADALAPLDAAGLRQVLNALVGRHLVLREADDSFSVHPAVRDHFAGLAAAAGQGAWHDLIRERLMSLVRRPGQRLPEEPATLDLVEEAIYHALAGSRTEEAAELYNQVLGGLRHLGWKLGEMARGLRILRGFNPCPDAWALAWYERALGEMEEAYRNNPLPYFRADIRLLQGRLPEVAAEDDATRTALALFLMGRTQELPPDTLGSVVPRDQLLIYLGRLDRARRSEIVEPFYKDIGWEGDRARCRLIQAEVARRQADRRRSYECLYDAARWILHSGSVEHLCLLHLMRARVARDEGDLVLAQQALNEGLHLARHCRLGLYLGDLLCEQAEVDLALGKAASAETSAREALRCASAAECQLQWTAAEAGHLLGKALHRQQRLGEARDVLEKTLALREQLGDPRHEDTERLLMRLKGR